MLAEEGLDTEDDCKVGMFEELKVDHVLVAAGKRTAR